MRGYCKLGLCWLSKLLLEYSASTSSSTRVLVQSIYCFQLNDSTPSRYYNVIDVIISSFVTSSFIDNYTSKQQLPIPLGLHLNECSAFGHCKRWILDAATDLIKNSWKNFRSLGGSCPPPTKREPVKNPVYATQ